MFSGPRCNRFTWLQCLTVKRLCSYLVAWLLRVPLPVHRHSEYHTWPNEVVLGSCDSDHVTPPPPPDTWPHDSPLSPVWYLTCRSRVWQGLVRLPALLTQSVVMPACINDPSAPIQWLHSRGQLGMLVTFYATGPHFKATSLCTARNQRPVKPEMLRAVDLCSEIQLC